MHLLTLSFQPSLVDQESLSYTIGQHWTWLRPCHLLPGPQKCAVPGQGATSPSAVPGAAVDLISNVTCCNQDKFHFYTVHGLFIHCWLKLNISLLLLKDRNSLSPGSGHLKITQVSHKTAATNSSARAHGTSWVKPFLEADLRHTTNFHRWKRWLPPFHVLPQAQAELPSSG